MSPVELINHYEQAKLNFALSQAADDVQILYRVVEADMPQVETPPKSYNTRILGICLILLSIGGLMAAVFPFLKLEATYKISSIKASIVAFQHRDQNAALMASAQNSKPEINPLIAPDGKTIEPVNQDFSIIIPKIGVNAPIIAGVDPTKPQGYSKALHEGVAHSNTSFYPNENGTVYLFSHSTNYEWFVKDLNAVFYLINKLDDRDLVVVMYLGNRYTYQIREKKIVGAHEVGYMIPQVRSRNLILQSCWPPGTVAKRMLIFADLVDEKVYGKFTEVGYE